MSDDNNLPVLADPVVNEIANLERDLRRDYDGFMKSGKADRLKEIRQHQAAGKAVEPADGIDGRMRDIRKLMWNPDGSKGPYYVGPDAKRLQSEFATLAEAKAGMSKAAAKSGSYDPNPAPAPAATDTARTLATSHSPATNAERAALVAQLPKAVVEAWSQSGVNPMTGVSLGGVGVDSAPFREAHQRASDAAASILSGVGDNALAVETRLSFDVLPENVRAAALYEMSAITPSGVNAPAVTNADLAAFIKLPEGRALVNKWGMGRAPIKLGIIRMRMARMMNAMGAEGAKAWEAWFNALDAKETVSILHAMVGSR